jgi:hypothetical protein
MSPTWTEVALAALNVVQTIGLAWLAQEAVAARRERKRRSTVKRSRG